MLLTPPNVLLHLGTYADVTKQLYNPMFDILKPVNSAAKMDQPAQPEEPEAWVFELSPRFGRIFYFHLNK